MFFYYNKGASCTYVYKNGVGRGYGCVDGYGSVDGDSDSFGHSFGCGSTDGVSMYFSDHAHDYGDGRGGSDGVYEDMKCK